MICTGGIWHPARTWHSNLVHTLPSPGIRGRQEVHCLYSSNHIITIHVHVHAVYYTCSSITVHWNIDYCIYLNTYIKLMCSKTYNNYMLLSRSLYTRLCEKGSYYMYMYMQFCYFCIPNNCCPQIKQYCNN